MTGGWPRGRARDGGLDEVPLPIPTGGLWLCGKRVVGDDPEGALARVGGDAVVVCLTERHELADRYPSYVDWLVSGGAGRAVWHPIPDLHAPTLREVVGLVDELVGRLHAGQQLLVHCGAGIGRAGTLAVCLLLRLGVDRDSALALVDHHRPTAGPEVGAQRDLVDALDEWITPR